MSTSPPPKGSSQRTTPSPDPIQPPSTLPKPLTSFLGRGAEIGEILAILDDDEVRLLTLTGPGGVGKTRLAIEVARHVEDDFADGAIFVRLATLRETALVLPAISQTVGVTVRDDRALIEQVAHALRYRHQLLVLDNFEHLLADTPMWLPDLLERCPRLKVLITSRVPLSLGGERRYLVSPLPVPQPDSTLSEPENTAVRLFVQRARTIRSDFRLTEENAEAVAEICRKVDGLPLAIELAASRATSLSPAGILLHLTDRFSLLKGGQRDAPIRMRSMHDAIDWSYDLLSSNEQRLFRQLSVFVGGFTLDAGEMMAGSSALDGVTSLVDKSLVRLIEDVNGETRYLMLETIREYGLEQLIAAGEEDAARHRHADWCLALTDRLAAATEIILQPNLEAIGRLANEDGNLRLALRWLDESGRHDDLATLAIELRWHWQATSRDFEGSHWYERVLTVLHPSDARYVSALIIAGIFGAMVGATGATARFEQARTLARASGNVLAEAEATGCLAIEAEDSGDYDVAEDMFQRAIGLFARTTQTWVPVAAEYHLGVVAYGKGELARAVQLLENACALAEEAGDPFVFNWSHCYFILIACEHGEYDRASGYVRHRLAVANTGYSLLYDLFLAAVSVLACAKGKFAVATRLLGASAQNGVRLMLPERLPVERAEAEARRQLGNDAYQREWETGSRMRPLQIRAEVAGLVTEDDAPPDRVQPSPSTTSELTDREREVLRLMADGLTNQEIADTLFISPRTVATHAASILGKLGLTSRTGVVAYAIRNGLA